MSQTPPQIPMRVEPLQYAPVRRRRPGILTAVGVLSIVVGFLSIIMSCGGMGQALFFQMRLVRPTPVITQAAAPGPSLVERMKYKDRKIVIAALSGRARLSPARQGMLEKLLREAGDRMFSSSQLSEASVASDISQSGLLPGVDGKAGNDYFIITSGRIEVGDDQAAFSPVRGETVRVYSDSGSDRSSQPVRTYSTATMAGSPFVPKASAMLYGIGSLLNLLLAIFLLVSGIILLASTRRGRGLHLTYAWIKIPLVVLTSIVYVWMRSDSPGPFSNLIRVTPTATWLIVSWAITEGCIACIYPVALLLVMRSPSAQDYFSETIG